MPSLRRLLTIACWLAIAVAYVAAILPQQDAPHLGGSDKTDHMAAFFAISFLARLAYPRLATWRLFLPIAGFGGLIELSQLIPFIHRDAEWGDWLADVAATIAGLVLAWPIAHWFTGRSAAAGLGDEA